MAGLGYKDFTAGAVLTAAQVDGYLMEQSVMNFAGTAARGSALSSVQSAGMMAHVGGGTVTVYDGSAWQQVYPASAGLTYIAGTAFTAGSAISVNNCFTSTYDNYRIIIDFSAASTNLTVSMRMRVGGADSSATSYALNQIYNDTTTTVANSQGTGQTQWDLGSVDATVAPYLRIPLDIFGPQLTRFTTLSGSFAQVGASTPTYFTVTNGMFFTATTSFDGFSLLTSTGTISGTVRVYGYRNS